MKVQHGVTFNETSKVPLIPFGWLGEEVFKQATWKRYAYIDEHHMLPNGIHSASEHLAGVGAFRSTETCNVSDYILTHVWMYRMSGYRFVGDRIERAFFNAGPAPLTRDAKMHAYYQAPNRLNRKLQGYKSAGSDANMKYFHKILCCTSNVTRILPNYILHMWMETRDDGLAATLYGPSTLTTDLSGNSVTIATVTDYPFDETIRMVVTPDTDFAFPLSLRIPAWCDAPRLQVNGQAMDDFEVGKNGFVRLERTWQAGDTIDLTFPMKPHVIKGQETEGAPFASVKAGPLLFALGIPEGTTPWTFGDNWKGHPENNVSGDDWKYALDFDANNPTAELIFEPQSNAQALGLAL